MSGVAVFGDWGTSRLRLYRMAEGGAATQVEAPGIGVAAEPPAKVLLAALAAWRQEGAIDTVWLCGMAGARGGLVETDYLFCPAGPDAWAAAAVAADVDGIRVVIAPGVALRNGARPDVMRGEEAQIFGVMALDPALRTGEHLIVLPGTHSKWARIADGRIVAFQTYPTGELYDLLARRSTLVADDGQGPAQDEGDGFACGLDRAGPGMLAALFAARASQLLDKRSGAWARGYLSGLLIGSEIAGETINGAVAPLLIGDPLLSERYQRVLARFSGSAPFMDGQAAVLAGLDHLRSARG